MRHPRSRVSEIAPNDTRCPFCLIARGLDPDVDLILERPSWLAFFPVDPATVGHTLVIPRNHVADLWDLKPEEDSNLLSATIEVGQAIQKALHPEGMNLITSAGAAAEQTIFHLHLHLVPRWDDDGLGRIWPPDGKVAKSLRDDAAQLIRAALE